MSVCRCWFVIYIMFTKGTVSTFNTDLSKINIDLKTYVDIDEKDTEADIKFLIKNKEITGDVKIIIDEDDHLHRKFGGKNVLTFTDFIYSMTNILNSFNDNDLEYFCAIFDDEIRKYHYQGCRFYELTENTAFRQFVASKLGIIRQKPPNTIRSILVAIADEIEKINFDDSKKELVHLVNSLYKRDSIKKLKNFLNDIEEYGNTSIKNRNLVQIIRKGIRSILFDHYTELHKIIRVELKNKMNEFFGNNVKTSTVILAQITNEMILDFNLSHINSGKKEGNVNSFANGKPNYVTIPGMRNSRLTMRRKNKLNKYNEAKIDYTTLKFQPASRRKPLRFAYIKRNKTKTTAQAITYTNKHKNTHTYTNQHKNIHPYINEHKNTHTYTYKHSNEDTYLNKHTSVHTETAYTYTKTNTKRKVTTVKTTQESMETTDYGGSGGGGGSGGEGGGEGESGGENYNTPKHKFAKTSVRPRPSKDKVHTSWDGTTDRNVGFVIVTMKPYSPRNVTSFGKMQYIVNLNGTDERGMKIPGLFFEKPLRIMGVGTAGIGEVIPTPVTYNKDMSILRREVEDEKNIIFYRSGIKPDTQNNKLSRFRRIPPHKFVNYRRSNEPLTIKSGQNRNKSENKENVIVNLRINVDDYLKKMNITPSRWNENTRTSLETNKLGKNKAKPVFRGEEYTNDSFNRGKNNWYLRKKENQLITRPSETDTFIKGHTFNYGRSSTNLKNDNLNSNEEIHQTTHDVHKYTQRYFNNYTNEGHDHEKYVTSNTLETEIMRNVRSQEDETLAKSNEHPLPKIDKEKSKYYSPDQIDQSYERNYNKSKNNDNSNSENNAGIEKLDNERKQQSESNEKATELKEYDQQPNIYGETELKEKENNNKFYFDRDKKKDDNTKGPYIKAINKFRQTNENELSYAKQKTKVQSNYISTRSISKEFTEENKPENEWIQKPRSRFNIETRNNDTDLTDNQTYTNIDGKTHKNDEISTFNSDGNLSKYAINRRNYVRHWPRDNIGRRNNIDNEIKDERYITETDRTKNQINENDIVSKNHSNNIKQNILKQKNDNTNGLAESVDEIKVTQNPIDFSKQTTLPTADDEIDIGTITPFDLSKEITAPNVNETDAYLKALEERNELAYWLDRKIQRKMKVDRSLRDPQVTDDFNLTQIYSDEVTNDHDLYAPPPTSPKDFE